MVSKSASTPENSPTRTRIDSTWLPECSAANFSTCRNKARTSDRSCMDSPAKLTQDDLRQLIHGGFYLAAQLAKRIRTANFDPKDFHVSWNASQVRRKLECIA